MEGDSMALLKWDPFRELFSIQERMNRLFDETFSGTKIGELGGVWSPVVDVYETNSSIVLKAELPGIEKDDVTVEVDGSTLFLKGERRFEKDVKEENYHRMERFYGVFQRVFELPGIIDRDSISAKYNDGVLEIRFPKTQEAGSKQTKVEVE